MAHSPISVASAGPISVASAGPIPVASDDISERTVVLRREQDRRDEYIADYKAILLRHMGKYDTGESRNPIYCVFNAVIDGYTDQLIILQPHPHLRVSTDGYSYFGEQYVNITLMRVAIIMDSIEMVEILMPSCDTSILSAEIAFALTVGRLNCVKLMCKYALANKIVLQNDRLDGALEHLMTQVTLDTLYAALHCGIRPTMTLVYEQLYQARGPALLHLLAVLYLDQPDSVIINQGELLHKCRSIASHFQPRHSYYWRTGRSDEEQRAYGRHQIARVHGALLRLDSPAVYIDVTSQSPLLSEEEVAECAKEWDAIVDQYRC